MEKMKNIFGKESVAQDEEGVKEETGDEMETPTGSSFFGTSAPHTAVKPPPTPTLPLKEKRKEKQHHSSKRAFSLHSGNPTKETITAWEKVRQKSPGRSARRLHPPRFARLLDRLSEERLESQEKSDTSMEPQKEEEKEEDLDTRPSSQEDLTDQSDSLSQLEEVSSVETVGTEPKGLEEEVPSTSKGDEELSVTSSQSSIELEKKSSSVAAFRRVATVQRVHSKVMDPRESVTSSDSGPSVWRMGQRISHWKQAHQRGYHIDQITQDKVLKNTIMKHERDTKAAVPLPLQEVMEEEVLAILTETLKAYQKQLGVNHFLTLQLEEQAEKIHLRLKGRGVIK